VDRLIAAEARVKVLEEALRPFAQWWRYYKGIEKQITDEGFYVKDADYTRAHEALGGQS